MIGPRFEITSTSTTPRSGNSKRTGKPYSFRIQAAYVHLDGKPYPEEIEILLDDSTPPHAPGWYVLAKDAYYVDRNRAFSVSPRLVREA
jgi:Helix-destabilising protein